MADKEQKGDMFSRIKDYPEIIKGVEDDSQKLIETQNEVMSEKFGDMRSKITQSIKKLHLGVIEKTVDTVVQSIIDKDLVVINKTVNAEFAQRFNSLLGNLMENVDEIMSVGKVMDAVEKVNEYIQNLAYDDALALLDLTIVLIRKPELEDQKQSLIDKKKEVEGLKKLFDKNIKRINILLDKLNELQKDNLLVSQIIEVLEEIILIAPQVGKHELVKKYNPILEKTKREYTDGIKNLSSLEKALKEFQAKRFLVEIMKTCREIIRIAPTVGEPELIEKYNPILGKTKEDYNEHVALLKELENNIKEYQAEYLLNEIIETCDQLIKGAYRIGEGELESHYVDLRDETQKELDELKKATIIANENYELLTKNGEIVDAHALVDAYKKNCVLYLKKPPIPLINELLSKEEESWNEWETKQKGITSELEELESTIHIFEDNDDYVNGDQIWDEKIKPLLTDLWDADLKAKWKEIQEIYTIKKKVYESLIQSTELTARFSFEEAFTLLNVSIDLVAGRNLIEQESKLKTKKDEVYAAQARFTFLNRKLKRLEKKFNENFYNNFLIAAVNYANKIVEIAEQVGEDEIAETYKQKIKELEQKLEEIQAQQLKEQEELQKNLDEVKELIAIDDDVLPILDKFSTEDVLGDLSGDIDEMLSQVSSLLGQNRVEVKQEIANKAVLKTAGGEVIQNESEITVQKLGDEDTESIFYSAQSTMVNTYKDTIEEALLTDLIPYNFEITNVEINGKPVEELPDKTLTKHGLELKWELENIPPKEKIEITYDLRRRISRTIVFILEGELKIIKTHSTLTKLQMEGFFDAELPFNNTYGKNLEGVVIEDIIPLYYLHMIKEPTNLLPSEVTSSKNGELVKWELGTLEQVNLDYRYRLLELYRFEEIKIAVDSLNKQFMDLLEKNELASAVEKYHEMGTKIEEYHARD